MDSTLDKRIAAMRGSLMDTALEAAESRGQRLAGVAHTLYALYRDDGFAGRLLRAPGYSEIQMTSDGERMWPQWEAYLFTPDGYRRTVDGPQDAGLAPDRAAELFFHDIMASIEQGEDR